LVRQNGLAAREAALPFVRRALTGIQKPDELSREEAMNLNFSRQTQQVQSQAITAQLIQSIKLLQYNQRELEAFISEEAEKNPLIEVSGVGDSPYKSGPADLSSLPGYDQPTKGGEVTQVFADSCRDRGPEDPKLTQSERTFQSAPIRGVGSSVESYRGVEATIAASVTLRDHLRGQLGMALRSPADLTIATELIESLDDDGYLRRDIGMIADALNTSEAHTAAVLGKIQKMDPAGVAARNLPECLRLQFEDEGRLTPAMASLLDNLPLLANYEYRQLAIICGVEVDDILAMAKEIKDLDPRPGRRFDCGPVMPALPDVTVELRDDGAFVTELNTNLLPRVLVNREYYSEVKAKCRGTSDVKFVVDCIKSANWLVRSLDQRAQTILKVATEIVARQRDFLLHGVEHLKPLNLKQVADKVGIHQSTVCRAISNKYMMTNRGLYELRFFFANSVAAADGGESLSADSVRHRIRQMIDSETADTVLSDDAIVKALRSSGVDIARRTVAKYREGMNIPSSSQRRRRKCAGTETSRTLSKTDFRVASANRVTSSGGVVAGYPG
jgi:RNA polymerase sigma-54 factor